MPTVGECDINNDSDRSGVDRISRRRAAGRRACMARAVYSRRPLTALGVQRDGRLGVSVDARVQSA